MSIEHGLLPQPELVSGFPSAEVVVSNVIDVGVGIVGVGIFAGIGYLGLRTMVTGRLPMVGTEN